jgi:hypothetical protein
MNDVSNRFFPIHFIMALSLLGIAPAWAQRAPVCETDYELIINMRDAEYGSYNVWDTVSGLQDQQERFKSGLVVDSGQTVVAGERYAHPDAPVSVVLAEIDRRGRILWEAVHEIKNLIHVEKVLLAKDGYVVVGTREVKGRRSVWLGFFDVTGALKSEQLITSPAGHLDAHDMIMARDVNKGYLLAASFEGTGLGKNIHSVLYTLDRAGKVVAHHAYTPGSENMILSLNPTGKDQYIATGYIYSDDGRKAGWLVKLDNDGGINWQRQYARGMASELTVAQDLLGKYIAVAGDSQPSGSSGSAGWLMVVGAVNGDIGWQRYFTGAHDYAARDLSASRDGLISLVLQGTAHNRDQPMPPAPVEKENETDDNAVEVAQLEKKTDFVRMMTVNPRGGVFISDEYFNGEGARAYEMVIGPVGERIFIGDTDMMYTAEPKTPKDEPAITRSLDGWVAAAASSEPYVDPCLEPYDFVP